MWEVGGAEEGEDRKLFGCPGELERNGMTGFLLTMTFVLGGNSGTASRTRNRVRDKMGESGTGVLSVFYYPEYGFRSLASIGMVL